MSARLELLTTPIRLRGATAPRGALPSARALIARLPDHIRQTCDFDGRPYVRALGSDDTGFCRPNCAQAAARRGSHANA